MNKETMMRLIKCAVTLLLLIGILVGLTPILERKDSFYKFNAYYEQEEPFDVLFLGTSHVHSGVNPMDLYEQNGIASYVLASPTCRMASAYWTLRSALDYETPKLVVLDCAYMYYDEKVTNTSSVHRIFDEMPLGPTKIAALLDLFEGDWKQIYELIFPFFVYHGRWDELTEKDLRRDNAAYRMGYSPALGVVDKDVKLEFPSDGFVPYENISTTYLRMITQECKQNGIELLLMFIPFEGNEKTRNDALYVRHYAQENCLNYLGPEQLSDIFDKQADYFDNLGDNCHLNISGAHKLSLFLGNYIADHYSIPDRRTDADYGFLREWYSDYREDKAGMLTQSKSLLNYLLLLSDRNLDFLIQIHNSNYQLDGKTTALLRNLGIKSDMEEKNGNYFSICGNEKLTKKRIAALLENRETELNWIENQAKCYTVLGGGRKVSYNRLDGAYVPIGNTVIVSREQGLTLLAGNQVWMLENTLADTRIVVVDHETGTLIDTAEFCDGKRLVDCNNSGLYQ